MIIVIFHWAFSSTEKNMGRDFIVLQVALLWDSCDSCDNAVIV